MNFTKMQDCGNDYVYINCFEEDVQDPAELAVRLSDRHYGIGSDGLILIRPSQRADAYMQMFNKDGSEGMMCGNGIRCVTKYIYDNRLISEDRRTAVIETPAGLREVSFETEDGKVNMVTVDMGTAAIRGIDRMKIGDDGYSLSYISMDTGNPHAVIFLRDNTVLRECVEGGREMSEDELLGNIPVEAIGRRFEESERFPHGVNVEFISIDGRDEISMRVWERGSGETLACGTGATASAAAGCITGRLGEDVLVHLAGGNLRIHYDIRSGNCRMTGSAVTVFTGNISEDYL